MHSSPQVTSALSPEPTSLPAPPAPRCVFVAGPPRAGKSRWLQERIRALAVANPRPRLAVLLGEEGRTRWENFAREIPGLVVHRLTLPCLCCPALANLPAAVGGVLGATGADWLFFEVPAIAAGGMIAEFDRALGWPREIVLCMDARFAAALRSSEPPYFMSQLAALADTVVAPPPDGPG